jgi:transposase-like protein
VQVNIKNLIDDGQCYQTVRELRWPDGIKCPSCTSKQIIKRGFDDTEPARQRYECHDCDTRFDDVTDTIFAGHHQPLKVWVLCLYFMGLNVSNEQRLILDSRVVIGQFWCNRLFLQAFYGGRDRGGIFGKSLLISNT